MIDRIEITAFKSIQEAKLELGAFNVFVGANGSGKSNILEAIGVLGAAAAGRVNDESLLYRGVRPGLPDLYKTSFRGHKRRNAIRFGAYSGASSYEVELNNPSNQSTAWSYKTETWLSAGKQVVGRSPASSENSALDSNRGLAALEEVKMAGTEGSQLLSALQQFSIYTPNTLKLKGIETDLQSRAPLGLAGGRLAEASEELRRLARKDEALEDVIEGVLELVDWIDHFGASAGSDIPLSPSIPRPAQVLFFRDRYMDEGQNIVSAYDASEGALYVLFAAILAAHPDSPRLLAIDNFDATLNPRLVRSLASKMVEWVLDRDRQLLMTCHNPLVLDGLPLQDERVRLFAVDRSYGGMTVIRRIVVDDALMAKAKEGWPLSRLWVTGHLGGMPNV
ncbi:MAG: AAA family ATPase [Synechococcaceae cyanobacterium]|jgi:predicted ATPase